MNITGIIVSLQELRKDLIIGSIQKKEFVDKEYKADMTDEEFNSKRFKYKPFYNISYYKESDVWTLRP